MDVRRKVMKKYWHMADMYKRGFLLKTGRCPYKIFMTKNIVNLLFSGLRMKSLSPPPPSPLYENLRMGDTARNEKLELWEKLRAGRPEIAGKGGCVYIYTSPHMIVDDLFKIGQTSNPSGRRTELNCSNPNGEFVKLYETSKPDLLEKKIHHLYKDLNYVKEWFRIADFNSFLVELEESIKNIEKFLISDLDKIVGKLVKQKIKACGESSKQAAPKATGKKATKPDGGVVEPSFLKIAQEVSSGMKIVGKPYQSVVENMFIYVKTRAMKAGAGDPELIIGHLVEVKSKKIRRHLWVKANGKILDSASNYFEKGEYKVLKNVSREHKDYTKCLVTDDSIVQHLYDSCRLGIVEEAIETKLGKKMKEFYIKMCEKSG